MDQICTEHGILYINHLPYSQTIMADVYYSEIVTTDKKLSYTYQLVGSSTVHPHPSYSKSSCPHDSALLSIL